MGDVRVGDVDAILDVNCGEDVSDASTLTMVMVRETDGVRKSFTGTLNGTQIVRYTTIATTDIPADGEWRVQIQLVRSDKPKSSTFATLTVDAKL